MIVLVMFAASRGGVAQEAGEIFGRVVDQQGLPLPGATVQVFPMGAAEPISVTVAADGSYRAGNLARGIYRIVFSLGSAFEPLVHSGIVLLAGEKMELNARLRPAPGAVESHPVDRPPLMDGEVLVRLETTFGAIDLAIDTRRAPLTADNFLRYVDGGFYDGGQFHRTTRPDNYTPAPPDRPKMELIQGGINPARRNQSFAPIALERTSVTGLKHVAGTVSMARAAGADTARSDFFILLDDQPSLDFGGGRFEDKQGGAAFGRVAGGLDVVRTIQRQPSKGQTLTPPIPILKAYRVR
jgi:peptidyl-prolyl cis-trans isomerase A (cyclophilin A)